MNDRLAVHTGLDLNRRRTWMALSMATIPTTISFWAIVWAFVSEEAGSDQSAAAAGALGLALLPLVFAVVAFGSHHGAPVLAVFGAVSLGLCAALPIIAVTGDIVTGLVAGFASGAAVALRREPSTGLGRRLVFAGGACILTLLLVRLVPAVILTSGPALALVAVGLADGPMRRASGG